MRYDCDDPAFAGDFVELSDTWSRAQVRAAWAAIPGPGADKAAREGAEERLLECLRPKIIALHLTCVDSDPITDVAELTPERTAEMDTRLYAWFASLWMHHLNTLADLGNALGRRLFDASAGSDSTPATTGRPSPKS